MLTDFFMLLKEEEQLYTCIQQDSANHQPTMILSQLWKGCLVTEQEVIGSYCIRLILIHSNLFMWYFKAQSLKNKPNTKRS
jgi:hypothetical protein